jgi:hypothetical protein
MKIGSVLVESALLLDLGPTWGGRRPPPQSNSNFPINTTTYYSFGNPFACSPWALPPTKYDPWAVILMPQTAV